MFRRTRLRLWLPVLMVSASACTDDKRAACNAVIDAINPHTPALRRAVENLVTVQSDPATIHTMRTAISDADAAVKAMQLEDARLAGLVLSYRRQLHEGALLADRLDAANGAPAKLHDAVQQADAFLGQQDKILVELNAYCAADAGV